MRLEPVPAPPEVIAAKTAELKVLQARVAALLEARRPLAQGAERSARRATWGLAGALLTQTAVFVKLTFFSRLGWEVMEPIVYFVTLGVGVASLLFFQVIGVEFTYPALRRALVGRYMRKAVRARGFDEMQFQVLADAVVKKHKELAVLPGADVFFADAWAGIASARATAEAPDVVEVVHVVNRGGNVMQYNFLTGEVREDPGPLQERVQA